MKVSAITPTYGRAEFLREAIASFLSQDYPDKEMVVVDDGSETDYAEQAVKKANDSRIIFRKIPHSGQPGATNACIEAASGEVVTVLHDDDVFENEKSLSARAAPFALNPDIEVVWTGYREVINGKAGEPISACPPNVEMIWETDYICFPTMAWKKNIHDRIGMFPAELPIMNMDWWFKIKCLMECWCYAIPDSTLRYRIHSNQLNLRCSPTVKAEEERIMRRMLNERYGGIFK